MRLTMMKYTCQPCGNSFRAPELGGYHYGDFLMRSAGSDALRLLCAIDEPTYAEVATLIAAHPWRRQPDPKRRAAVLQAIYGPVACDPDADGAPFHIGQMPACPACGSRDMASWDEGAAPESVDMQILPASHAAWAALDDSARRRRVEAVLVAMEDDPE